MTSPDVSVGAGPLGSTVRGAAWTSPERPELEASVSGEIVNNATDSVAAMERVTITLTLDHGVQSELVVIEAKRIIKFRRLQQTLRAWMSHGCSIALNKRPSVDRFTASGETPGPHRVHIHMNPGVPEDKAVLDAFDAVPKKSRGTWAKEVLISGFEARFQNRVHIDINLDDPVTAHVENGARLAPATIPTRVQPPVVMVRGVGPGTIASDTVPNLSHGRHSPAPTKGVVAEARSQESAPIETEEAEVTDMSAIYGEEGDPSAPKLPGLRGLFQ